MVFVDVRIEIQFFLFLLEHSLLVDRKRKGRLVVIFSLSSSPTVDTESKIFIYHFFCNALHYRVAAKSNALQ